MVRRRVVGDAELEAVAVTLKWCETPTVETVAPRVHFVERHGGAKHVQVQTIINVVPKTGIAEDVAFTGTLLASETVGTLTVLTRVAVTVGVKVYDLVVGGSAFELEAGLIIVMSGETFVVVVGGISGINAIRAVDDPVKCEFSDL